MKFSSPAILVSVSVSLLTGASVSDAFTISMPSISIQNHNLIPRSSTTSKYEIEIFFGLQMASSSSSSSDAEENDNLVTNEMFMREMLSHPNDDDDDHDNDNDNDDESTSTPREINKDAKVRRKKRNGSHYRTLDNRDSLPFIVKVATPDPYTTNAQMHSEAKLNSRAHKAMKNEEAANAAINAKKKSKNGNSNGKKSKDSANGKRRHNLVGMNVKDSITSSIYSRAEDGTMHKVVGEFALDKSTNCGDVIEVGDGTEYIVQKSRCQYKYAGGKRFIMVRKILEVKEVKRLMVEKEVKELFEREMEMEIDEDGGGVPVATSDSGSGDGSESILE